MGPTLLEAVDREKRDNARDKVNTDKYIKLIIDRHRLPY